MFGLVTKEIIDEEVIDLISPLTGIMYESLKSEEEMSTMFDVGYIRGVLALAERLRTRMAFEGTGEQRR